MMFWINGGKAAACQLSPLVTSVITPVSKFTSTSSPTSMPFAAASHSRMGRPLFVLPAALEQQTDVLVGIPHAILIQRAGAAGKTHAGQPVVLGYDDVAGMHILYKIRVDVLHCVGGQLLGVRNIQITCGNDNVGIDVIAVLENLAFCVHGMCFLPYFRSSGAQM